MSAQKSIRNLVELPYILDQAESVAEKSVEKGDEKYFEAAYGLLEGSWRRTISADRELSRQYENTVDDFEGEVIESYSIDLGSLDEDSHPALVALALPRYFQLLRETEEELKELAENEDFEPSDYQVGEILPKES